jgi:hypothetical protein
LAGASDAYLSTMRFSRMNSLLQGIRAPLAMSVSLNFNLLVMFISPTRSTLVETQVEVIHEHCRERETQP